MTTATATAPVISMSDHRRSPRAKDSCHDCGQPLMRDGVFCDPCILRDDVQ